MSTWWKRAVYGVFAAMAVSFVTVGIFAEDAPAPKLLPISIPASIPPADTPLTNAVVPVQIIEPVRPEAAVALEWSGPPTVRINRTNEYQLAVRNTSSQIVQKVVVQVRAPKGTSVKDTSPAAKVVDGVYLWELGTLDVKEAKHLKLSITTTTPGEMGCQAWVTFTGTAGMKVNVQEPKLKITITAPEKVAIGDPVPVTYTVKNIGDCTAENVQHALVQLETPKGVMQTIATLAPGEERKEVVQLRANAGGEMNVTAEAKAADCQAVSAAAKTQVLVPKLSVKVTGPDQIMVNRKATYKVRVENVGQLAIKDVKVRRIVPTGWRMVTGNWLANSDAEPDLFINELIPGQGSEATFEASPLTTGQSSWFVEATGSRGTKAVSECRTAVEGIAALRMELVDLVDPVEKGQRTTYEIRITNTGTKADNNVVITCPVPEQMKFISATGPVSYTATALNNCTVVRFEPVRELAPKTEIVFRIICQATTVGDVRFKAQLNSTQLTTSVAKEESTRVYGE